MKRLLIAIGLLVGIHSVGWCAGDFDPIWKSTYIAVVNDSTTVSLSSYPVVVDYVNVMQVGLVNSSATIYDTRLTTFVPNLNSYSFDTTTSGARGYDLKLELSSGMAVTNCGGFGGSPGAVLIRYRRR